MRPPAVPVVFVSSHAQLGGSERSLELLLRELGPAWVGGLVLLEDGPAVPVLAAAAGAEATVVPVGRRLGLLTGARRLRRALAGREHAVVHASGVKAALVATLARSRTPVVWVKHDFSWDGRLARFVAAHVAEVVGVSDAVLATLRGGRRPPTLTVVPNGVADPAVDAATARASLVDGLGVAPDTPIVVLAGRLHPAKGHAELIEAAPALLAAHPGARILLAGGADPTHPDLPHRLRARIDELGLGGAVLLIGHRDDAAALIAAADAVAVPSVPDDRGMGREGFGLVGVEALAAGTPIVAYADGALPEVLGDAALLVPAGDRAALAAGLVRLLDDAALRADLAERGRERFAARYRVPVMADAMAARYVAVSGGRDSTTAHPASTAASATMTFDRSV